MIIDYLSTNIKSHRKADLSAFLWDFFFHLIDEEESVSVKVKSNKKQPKKGFF